MKASYVFVVILLLTGVLLSDSYSRADVWFQDNWTPATVKFLDGVSCANGMLEAAHVQLAHREPWNWLPVGFRISVLPSDSPDDPSSNRIFVGLMYGGFLVSHDGGETWQQVGTEVFAGTYTLSVVEIGSTLYCGVLVSPNSLAAHGEVFKSLDGGATWQPTGRYFESESFLSGGMYLWAEEKVLYVSFGDSLFWSSDGALTWASSLFPGGHVCCSSKNLVGAKAGLYEKIGETGTWEMLLEGSIEVLNADHEEEIWAVSKDMIFKGASSLWDTVLVLGDSQEIYDVAWVDSTAFILLSDNRLYRLDENGQLCRVCDFVHLFQKTSRVAASGKYLFATGTACGHPDQTFPFAAFFVARVDPWGPFGGGMAYSILYDTGIEGAVPLSIHWICQGHPEFWFRTRENMPSLSDPPVPWDYGDSLRVENGEDLERNPKIQPGRIFQWCTRLPHPDDKVMAVQVMYGYPDGVEEGGFWEPPKALVLNQNYPNPFNPITEIRYDLPVDCRVRLEIYNLLGQRVRTLVDGNQMAGYQSMVWDSRNDRGEEVTAGIYFYQISAGDFTAIRKMVLLK